jgi:hypothetical protein
MTKTLSPDELIDYCSATGCTMAEARMILEGLHPKLRKRVVLAVQTQDPEDGLKDPIEFDEIFGPLVKAAEVKAEKNINYNEMGACHLIWEEQARILKEEHGIDWYSPAEMNPFTLYD